MNALETIADRLNIASRNAERSRGIAKEHGKKQTEMGTYYEGKACAYNDAHETMKAELRHLMNKFQNGSLSLEDFGVEP